MKWSDGAEEYRQQQPEEKSQPVEELAEVVSGGGEDGVDGVALFVGEIIAPHAVLILDVAYRTLS